MQSFLSSDVRPIFSILFAVATALLAISILSGCVAPKRLIPIPPDAPVDRYGLPLEPRHFLPPR